MYKLYWCLATGAFAPEAVLSEAALDYERIAVDTDKDEHRSPDFLALNPMAQVPALVLPDGSLMTESAAMLLHLVDAAPEAGLAPAPGSPARAQFDRWLVFMAANLYEADLRIYYADRYTADPAGAAAVRTAGLAHLDRSFDILETLLSNAGPFVLGAGYSALDPYLAMLVWWHPEPPALYARCPHIAALCRQVRARPKLADLCREHFPTEGP